MGVKEPSYRWGVEVWWSQEGAVAVQKCPRVWFLNPGTIDMFGAGIVLLFCVELFCALLDVVASLTSTH